MVDLDEMLGALDGAIVEGIRLERSDKGFRARTTGDRKQNVRVVRKGDAVVMTSVAASKQVVPDAGPRRTQFIRRLWEINAHTDLVGFGLDGRDRVVGSCRHPLATLDRQELEVYLVALVRECDRLEWVFTGEDRY